MQTPPKFSALKIAGERAYDLAREGEEVLLEPRPVTIERLELVGTPDADHAEFVTECGKGTYVRAVARDLGRALNTRGHVTALRRTMVGPFTDQNAVSLDQSSSALPSSEPGAAPNLPLLPVEAALQGMASLTVSGADAARLARGQPVLLRGRDAPLMNGWVSVFANRSLLALAEVEEGEIRPRRIFNLAQ
jgi:tRNA pseudouridine55 synthase